MVGAKPVERRHLVSRRRPYLGKLLQAGISERLFAVGIFVAGVLYGISEMIAASVSGVGQSLASAFQNLF